MSLGRKSFLISALYLGPKTCQRSVLVLQMKEGQVE